MKTLTLLLLPVIAWGALTVPSEINPRGTIWNSPNAALELIAALEPAPAEIPVVMTMKVRTTADLATIKLWCAIDPSGAKSDTLIIKACTK
jgi:hypothetical protein